MYIFVMNGAIYFNSALRGRKLNKIEQNRTEQNIDRVPVYLAFKDTLQEKQLKY